MGNAKSGTGIRTSRVNRHVWTVEEEELALDLYFAKATQAKVEIETSKTVLKLQSMKMKIMNIQYLDTGVGLANVSSLTKSLYQKRVDNIIVCLVI